MEQWQWPCFGKDQADGRSYAGGAQADQGAA